MDNPDSFQISSLRKLPIRFGICAILLILGCTGSGLTDSSLARTTDASAKPDAFKEALATSLEAWQAGKVRELRNRQPPIRFVDDDVVSGQQLLEYTIQTASRKTVPFQQFQVELKLKDRQGRAGTSLATYQVSLSPRISVLRSDL